MTSKPSVLVVGGAGYIGSHMVWLLGQKGAEVVTLDNLCSGHRDAVLCGEFVLGDITDRELLDQLFSRHKFDAVMHFASHIQVGESVRDPAKYYRNNVVNALNLLDTMYAHGIDKFIFSSTAAIFGEPQYLPIDEAHPKQPLNPYGWSKLMVEQALTDYDSAYGLRFVCLRYFNAAGAHPEGILGERHDPETHLIPLVLQAANGCRPHITVYGEDYSTPDGTCIRDYVHVMDLVNAHWLALEHLLAGGSSCCCNLGSGRGHSVAEIIRMVKNVTARNFPVRVCTRRRGDPAVLVSNSDLAHARLGWIPNRSDLEEIIRDAWRFSVLSTYQ